MEISTSTGEQDPNTLRREPIKADLSRPRGAEGAMAGGNQAGVCVICGGYGKSWFVHGNRNMKSREKMFGIQRQNGGNNLLLSLSREELGAMSQTQICICKRKILLDERYSCA